MTAANEYFEVPATAIAVADKVPAWQRGYARRLVVIDAIGVIVAVGLAHFVRFGTLPGAAAAHPSLNYTAVSIAIAVSWMLALSINRSRSPRIIGSGAEGYRRVWMATTAVFGSVAVISMLFTLEIARGYLMIALPAGLVVLILFRWIARPIVVSARQN